MSELEHENWNGKTGGTRWMQRAMIKMFRRTPLVIPYWCMGWIIPFYMLLAHKGYSASYSFYRKRFRMNPLNAFYHVYLNHFRFGQIIIDRFAMYAGRKFEIEVDGQEIFDELESGECGFIQISSHVGNYELAGYSLVPEHKSFNALVFAGETETVMEYRERMFAANKVKMVAVNEDMSHIFILNNALRNGEIISMPGDRIFGSPRSITCDFFSSKARFPLGPFAMAVQRDVPILAVFVMKTGSMKYKIHLSRLTGETKESLAQCFAGELERIAKKYPTQWFNFYDFWK